MPEEIKHVEVLVASTVPATWEVIKNDLIATQAKNSANADYIAFLLTRRKNTRCIITHIAKVKSTNNSASVKDYLEKYPQVTKFSIENKRGWENQKYHKEYYLEDLKELSEPILCREGEGRRCQVKLYTTLAELNKAKYFGDIKTIYQLRKEKENI